MKIYAIIPAYNESKMIAEVVSSVRPYVSEVVVIDDGSADSTGRVAAQAGAIVLRHILNRGQGAGLRTGTEYALSAGADAIVHFDADGQHDPAEIPRLIEPIVNGEADLVLGSRFLKDAHHSYSDLRVGESVQGIRRGLIKLGVLFTWYFSGVHLTDVHNGFRALSRYAAERIVITQDRAAHASEILDQIRRNNLRFVERPTTIKYTEYSKSRQDGVRSEGNLKKIKVAVRFFLSKLI